MSDLTDPDSRPVKTPRGFIQGYSAQVAVSDDQIIVAADVTVGGADGGRLSRSRARRWPMPATGEARRGPPVKKHALAAEQRARLETHAGRALYGKRRQIVEPVFGQTKATAASTASYAAGAPPAGPNGT